MITVDKKLIIYIFLSFCLISFTSAQIIHQMGVTHAEINLSIIKTHYYTYEPIYIEISYQNLSRQTYELYTNHLLSCLEVKNSQGDLFKFRQRVFINPPSFIILKPFDCYNTSINLVESFGIKDIDNYYSYLVLPPGKYFIRLGFQRPAHYDAFGYRCTYEKVYSNQYIIYINDPENEDKIAMDVFKEGLKYKLIDNYSLAELKFLKVLNNYPDSIYRLLAEKQLQYIQNRLYKR